MDLGASNKRYGYEYGTLVEKGVDPALCLEQSGKRDTKTIVKNDAVLNILNLHLPKSRLYYPGLHF